MTHIRATHASGRRRFSSVGKLTARGLLKAACVAFVLLFAVVSARAQGTLNLPQKLPKPDKLVGEYLKALGGKKRVAALRDSTYEWDVRRGGAAAGTARTHLKSPSSLRTDILLAGGETDAAANARSAWARTPDGHLSTLTDAQAHAAKLHALLEASRFSDYKKQKVLARTVGFQNVGGEAAYAVEFSTRAGARLRYWFGATNKLVLQMADEARSLRVRFQDWRARPGSPLLVEPHRLEIETEVADPLVLTLREARYNDGLAETLFDPPSDSSLDIPALLRDLSRNQTEVDRRINDYTFTSKITQREVNDRGELKKEKVSVYEVYPMQGWGWVMKLVSENGVPLAPERAAKEEQRVAEELLKAEREGPKRLREWEQKRERRRAERAAKRQKASGGASVDDAAEEDEDDDVGISTFLRASEFVSPRREHFRGRDVVVFDFRPRPGFKPSTRDESIAAKLAGVVWVDPQDRQVVRLEARLVEGFKMGGGLVASIKPGAAFAFEQTRLADGVWLPRFSQVNASAKILIFAGITVNQTNEFSDYKRFDAKADDPKLDAPKKPDSEKPEAQAQRP
jgi:hypothetical protein